MIAFFFRLLVGALSSDKEAVVAVLGATLTNGKAIITPVSPELIGSIITGSSSSDSLEGSISVSSLSNLRLSIAACKFLLVNQTQDP